MKPDPKSIPRPWLKHYAAHVPETLTYPTETLPELFKASTAKHGQRTAVKFLGKSLSHAQIEKSANAFAGYLTEKGIGKGDRVLLMMPNSPHFIIAYYAILKCGAIAVPASPLDTATEVEFKFRNSGAKLVIFLDLLFDKVCDLLHTGPNIPAVAADVSDYLRATLATYASVLKKYRHAVPPLAPQLEGGDAAVIIYTGGTTGISKGVVLSQHAMIVNMTQARPGDKLPQMTLACACCRFSMVLASA